MNISLHEIKQMFKEKFKTLVLKTVKSEALSWLLLRKSQSEKVRKVPYRGLIEIVKLQVQGPNLELTLLSHSNNKNNNNKLGLSCAKLRASFNLPGCYLIFV